MCTMPLGWIPSVEKQNQKSKIDSVLFVDSPEMGKLVLDFPRYVKTLSNMIEKSTPKFNIGIFGGWGTGKTTLMLNIENMLNENNTSTLRFNAWRYQNENSHATIPLMLNIITHLAKRKEIQALWNTTFKEKTTGTEQKKTETWSEKIKRVIKGLSLNVSFGIPGIAEIGVGYERPKEEEPEKEKARLEIERANLQKTTLQEGLDLIEELLKNIRGSENNLKLVVFVDDLDRCTPEKAIEVFESIKIFFDIEGIVFVLGLSNEIVELAIDQKYKFLEGRFSGEDYLKKIIQLPFTIPDWREEDIEKFLEVLLTNYKHNEYKNIFVQNKGLILSGVERNPREVKRFLNHFIIAYEIFGQEQGITHNGLMAIQALRLRWNWFFDAIFETNFKILGSIQELLDRFPPQHLKIILTSKKEDLTEDLKDPKIERLVSLPDSSLEKKVILQDELMNFLLGSGKIIFTIDRAVWPLYRRAGVEVKLESSRIREKSEVEQTTIDASISRLSDESKEIDNRIEELRKQLDSTEKNTSPKLISSLQAELEHLYKKREELDKEKKHLYTKMEETEYEKKRAPKRRYYK